MLSRNALPPSLLLVLAACGSNVETTQNQTTTTDTTDTNSTTTTGSGGEGASTGAGGAGGSGAAGGAGGGLVDPTITCGQEECDALTQVCCLEQGGVASCLDGESCTGPTLECTGPGNCPDDQICCANGMMASTCAPDCQGAAVCETEADCDPGEVCEINMMGFGTCAP